MKMIRHILLFATGIAALCSCSGTGDGGSSTPDVKSLVLQTSTTVIEADGTDAVQFTVLADGVPVTEDVRFYDGATNQPLDLSSWQFSTTTPGRYYFWAAYGTAHTQIVTINAVDFELPELPDDPAPDSTSFTRRVLLTQFTGTGCGWCPGMITILRNILSDENYADKVIHTAAHTYNTDDPAFLVQRLNQSMGVSGYPTVVTDMRFSTNNYLNEVYTRNIIDQAYEREPAKAGLAVATSYDSESLAVLVSVKAAEEAEFKVGAWVLEDGIYGVQANYGGWEGDYNTHDNCIRYCDGQNSNIDFTGFSVGTLVPGQTSEYVFTIDLDPKWVLDNCHVVVFVTTSDGVAYSVNNAVDVPLGGSKAFEYAE